VESGEAAHRRAFRLSSAPVPAPGADASIVVVAYRDDAFGVEIKPADGAGQFESVTLRPHAKLAAGSDENIARRLRCRRR
jgi:hypothetical protein